MPADAFTIPPDPRLAAYLFDLDGTLVDTEVLWVEATAAFLRARDKRVSDTRVGEWVQGRSWHDIYRSLVEAWPDLDVGVDALDALLRPFFLRLRDTRDVRIHGSVDLLRAVAKHSPVVIVSGSPRDAIAEAIEQMGVAKEVAFFLGSSDYAPGKPHPACFLAAAERLRVPAPRCVVFEDSTAGVRAARRAGMPVVALARPGAPEQDVTAADWVLADLTEFSPRALFERLDARPAPASRAAGAAADASP